MGIAVVGEAIAKGRRCEGIGRGCAAASRMVVAGVGIAAEEGIAAVEGITAMVDTVTTVDIIVATTVDIAIASRTEALAYTDTPIDSATITATAVTSVAVISDPSDFEYHHRDSFFEPLTRSCSGTQEVWYSSHYA